MRNLSVKNVPDELHERLRRSAASNHRSLDREVISCVERALAAEPRPEVTVLLEQIRATRKLYEGPPLTDRAIDAAKRRGRP